MMQRAAASSLAAVRCVAAADAAVTRHDGPGLARCLAVDAINGAFENKNGFQ
ncbi:MAG: hypothetical protein JWQ21_3164 [Herminiimonas sp.]|nr:hypothetical protein [Herminiimonas sp.]